MHTNMKNTTDRACMQMAYNSNSTERATKITVRVCVSAVCVCGTQWQWNLFFIFNKQTTEKSLISFSVQYNTKKTQQHAHSCFAALLHAAINLINLS